MNLPKIKFAYFWNHLIVLCREPNAEQKFKEISNAYEVKKVQLCIL